MWTEASTVFLSNSEDTFFRWHDLYDFLKMSLSVQLSFGFSFPYHSCLWICPGVFHLQYCKWDAVNRTQPKLELSHIVSYLPQENMIPHMHLMTLVLHVSPATNWTVNKQNWWRFNLFLRLSWFHHNYSNYYPGCKASCLLYTSRCV